MIPKYKLETSFKPPKKKRKYERYSYDPNPWSERGFSYTEFHRMLTDMFYTTRTPHGTITSTQPIPRPLDVRGIDSTILNTLRRLHERET